MRYSCRLFHYECSIPTEPSCGSPGQVFPVGFVPLIDPGNDLIIDDSMFSRSDDRQREHDWFSLDHALTCLARSMWLILDSISMFHFP